MKKLTGVVLAVLLSSTVFAQGAAEAQVASANQADRTMAQKIQLVKKMASYQIKQDIRVTQPVVVKEGICGADGPSIMVSLQVRKSVRTMNEKTQEVELKSVWQTIKTYGATAAELGGEITTGLMDSENCME